MSPSVLRVKLKTVTPAFIGGAHREQSELRPPSIKGLLRYWYRALDDHYVAREEKFFGSTERQSPCLLKIAGPAAWEEGSTPWNPGALKLKEQYSAGIRYLGYSLAGNRQSRSRVGIETEREFELLITTKPHVSESERQSVQRAWLAATWLLVNVGGIGARSRRGFGSLQLVDWSGWNDCRSLPDLGQSKSIEEWQNKFREGLLTIKAWFPEEKSIHSKRTSITSDIALAALTGEPTWEQALGAAGFCYQTFRKELKSRPEKACFGLPIILGKGGKIKADQGERWASPLVLRIVRVGDKFHPVFFLLSSSHPNGLSIQGERLTWPADAELPVREFLAQRNDHG